MRNFIDDAKRILRVSKKPSRDEYWIVAKVTGIGIIIVGIIGLIIQVITFILSRLRP
ncbi:MAG: protein translocase SEC61 complex subunit gamma [Euryarchaeota archaeon]|nr:protein translocase SEC61 complex subunit gamma [Euryarchaeota archaeon]